jgi:hypothetical protein
MSWASRLLPLVAAVALAGCAVVPEAAPQAGRVQLLLPAGDWVDLGPGDEAFQGEAAPPAALRTHAMGLRGADRQLLAVVLVQANPYSDPRNRYLWSTPCTAPRGLKELNPSPASPLRVDCLRYKPWADNGGWLRGQHPALAEWLVRHDAVPGQPYAHLDYRYSTETGAWVARHAVVDQRLLVPATRNAQEFLLAGLPGQQWSAEVARAARTSTAMLDGTLALPPFPIAFPR